MGTSTKPDTFDLQALSHVAKKALICLPNLRSQFVELTNKLAAYDPAGPDDATRTLAKMCRTRSMLSAPSATLTVNNRKRANLEPGVVPEQVLNQELAQDDAGRNVPRIHCPWISNTSATLAGIVKTIEHARGNQLH